MSLTRVLLDRVDDKKYLPQSMSLLSKEAKHVQQMTGDSSGDPILSCDRS